MEEDTNLSACTVNCESVTLTVSFHKFWAWKMQRESQIATCMCMQKEGKEKPRR
jgi:hypothetical protein